MTIKKVYFEDYDQSFVYDTGYCVYDATITDNLPDWWPSSELLLSEISGIQQGGCAGYAYMPAVVYSEANDHMADWGNDILEYIEEQLGDLPSIPKGKTWCAIASFYLCVAVELYVSQYDVDAIIERLESA